VRPWIRPAPGAGEARHASLPRLTSVVGSSRRYRPSSMGRRCPPGIGARPERFAVGRLRPLCWIGPRRRAPRVPAARAVEPPSSSGLGHRPFKAAARVRIPLGAPLAAGQRNMVL
jgi:hypothetical protein